MPPVFNRFVLCFFDVLGFETRFSDLGLAGMLEKYVALTRLVDERNEHMRRLFKGMEFSEGAYWTSEGDAFVFSRIYGAYASDSLLIWANADFPSARYPDALNLSPEERARRASEPGEGWKYHPVPCDNFLDLCNELLCHSLEIGLPLRGALAMGEAVLHLDRRIFLGQPLIDAARMEHSQQLIGASYTSSFMNQIVPKRYMVPFTEHLKSANVSQFQGNVLDWPRHWRTTRKTDPRQIVSALNTFPPANTYYENTIRMIDAADALANQYQAPEDIAIRKTYPQFASEQLVLHARAVRRVPIGDAPDQSAA
jgi:hypothetical protein